MTCVSVPPIISRAPQAASVQEDGVVTLSCQVVGTHFPVTRLTWTRDGHPLPTVRHLRRLVTACFVLSRLGKACHVS